MESTCTPSAVLSADDIDLLDLKERWRHEGEKRLQSSGEHSTGRAAREDFEDVYFGDPYMPVTPRPVDEELNVAVLGGGFGRVLTSCDLTQAKITKFRHINYAGDFSGVWAA